MSEYDTQEKQAAWEAMWQGYKIGLNVEQTDKTDEKVAKRKFESWWDKR